VAEISEETKAFVEGVAAEAIRVETPCGDGKMVWHIWGAGPPLALFHGGYGSWTHWIRNVLPLSRSFTVIAPDLPGLGESATPPEPHTAECLAHILVDGIDLVLPRWEPLHLAGFSFGGVLGGHVAAQLGDRVQAFTVVGSNGLGLIRQPTDLKRVPAGSTTAEALANGEIDFWEGISPDTAPFLRSRDIVVRRTNALPSVAFIRPNFQIPPFNDVRARRALALMFDQHELMAAVAGDNMKWDACYAFTVCGGPLSTEAGSEPYRKPDMAKAKELLAEAGYKGEKLVLLGTPNPPPISAMTQVVEARMREADIPVDTQMVDFATMFKRMNTADLDPGGGSWNLFAYYAIGGSWYHPLTNVSLDLSCDKKNWAGFPCDAEGEALRQKVLTAPDDASRKQAYEVFQRHLWDFIPYVPEGQFDVASAYRKDLTGVLAAYVQPYWNIAKP